MVPHGQEQTASWSMLPETARTAALRTWSGARCKAPGLGDGFVYDFVTLAAAPGYSGPLPFCIVTGRRRV